MDNQNDITHLFPLSLALGGTASHIVRYRMDELLQTVADSKLVLIDSGILQARRHQCADPSPSMASTIIDWLGKEYYTKGTCLVFPGGERSKGRTIFDAILHSYFQHEVLRNDHITVIGGGALCDTAAFATSVYMRGISVTLVPSTLLSMIDASIGGKTGINYGSLKNMVGSFYPASKIILVPELLYTLTPRMMRDGLAEILKAGMLYDGKILEILGTCGNALVSEGYSARSAQWDELIARAVAVKAMVIQKDFKEENIRAHLNLGHTFAHAQESHARDSHYDITHGEAVGLGIRAALHVGMRTKDAGAAHPLTNKDYAQFIFTLLDEFKYPNNYNGYSAKKLKEAMMKDKKRRDNALHFVLQRDNGHTIVHPVEAHAVLEVLYMLGAGK